MASSRVGKPHPHKGVHPSPTARAHESAAHKGKPHPHKGFHGHRAYHGRHTHAHPGGVGIR